MGKNNFLSSLNGKTLIENILDALTVVGINEQVVVLGNKLEEIVEVIKPRLGKVKIALNLDGETGIIPFFQTGLMVLSKVDAAFLVLGDQPIINSNLLTTMIQKMENDADALIVSPIHNGEKGHPLLFRRQLFIEILSLKDSQTIGDVVHAHADKLLTVEAPAWTIIDIDTSEKYPQ
jgi:molybdenum cofactor cytidylyltransferase